MDKNKLLELKNIAYYLMNGIDPTSKTIFNDDTIMNFSLIKRYNKDIYDILNMLLVANSAQKVHSKNKIPFIMSENDLQNFEFSEKPISISKLCFKLNNYSSEKMLKINAQVLSKGLCELGYLKTKKIDNEKNYKVPTQTGIELGIEIEKKINLYGNEYSVNLYNVNAQKYVINNLNLIIEAANKNAYKSSK